MIPNWPQINQSSAMRRDDVCIYEGPANRARLEAIIADRYSPSKAVWRTEIVLATADELGTNAIMTRTGKSKPCVRQERYVEEGVDGCLRDKARPRVRKHLSPAMTRKLLTKTGSETLTDPTRWIARSMRRRWGSATATSNASGPRPASSHTMYTGQRFPTTRSSMRK
jgi:hypothetical protein